MLEGMRVATPDGCGTVVKVSPFTGKLAVRSDHDAIPYWYHPSEVWPIESRK